MDLTWDSPLAAAAGKVKAERIKSMRDLAGLETVGALLSYFPRTYVAKGSLSDLDELVEGSLLSMVGQIVSAQRHEYRDRRTGRPAWRLETHVRGEGGAPLAVTWFDQRKGQADFHEREYVPGRVGMFSGRLKWWREAWQLTNPDARMWEDDAAGRSTMPDLIPIYREIAKTTTWNIEETVAFALTVLDRFPDVLPEQVRGEQGLVGAADAYHGIHRPADHAQLGAARKRLKWDEAFTAQVVLARRRADAARARTRARVGRAGGILEAFDARLPFTLTDGQRAVGEEIAADLAREHPMHRLLQGDVGSGKTLVALRAMLRVVDAGGQAVLLAPTEVLAQQHHRSITAMLGPLGAGGTIGAHDDATGVVLLTGSMGTAARRQALLDAASGEAGIVIGTHALLEDKVQLADLGLVVVDEQHRFGVEQRAALSDKAATPPHLLVMTATPIPRTVAMTVFGDLDTSTLTELPAGRGEVQTSVVPARARPGWLDRGWERIREEVAAGRQAYVVCSRISDEPSDAEGDDDRILYAVEDTVEMLRAGPLEGLRVEALHGRMSPEAKDAVMRAFAAGEVDVLVATTVIEVGVDVPNATVMVILDADRFGVSQLHQLRGRIGRGGHAGLCLLVTDADPRHPSLERLTAVAATRDGFELSRVDLQQRREGDLLGAQQSGRGAARALRLLSVLDDEDIIAAAREAATAHLAADPELAGTPDLAARVRALDETGRSDFLDRG
ncbi:MAG: ATP-dependent DNA helicase RecG [Marmoricola sp.]